MVEKRVDWKANKNENGEHYEYKGANQNNSSVLDIYAYLRAWLI